MAVICSMTEHSQSKYRMINSLCVYLGAALQGEHVGYLGLYREVVDRGWASLGESLAYM